MAVTRGIEALLRIGRNTRGLDRAIAFYRDALGCTVVAARPPAWTRLPGVDAAPARCAHLALGAQRIELTEFPDAAPYPAASAANDLWFQHLAIVATDLAAASARVLAHGGTPITRDGPQRLPPSTGSVGAFKFRDPDGHPLELIAFPAGVGDPAWQSTHVAGPTVGIDHTAISVGDADRSVAFYQVLGLHVSARGRNHGAEQQRLDDLADVEVDVVALQAATRTPHLELLGYRRPAGRPSAVPDPDAITADRVVWHAAHLEAVVDALAAAGCGPAVLADGRAADAHCALLRDPDGHLVVLTDSGP